MTKEVIVSSEFVVDKCVEADGFTTIKCAKCGSWLKVPNDTMKKLTEGIDNPTYVCSSCSAPVAVDSKVKDDIAKAIGD